MRFAVDNWDPGYGSSTDDLDLDTSTARVTLDVELPHDQWEPVPPPATPALPDAVVFVDGVRRIEAQLWLDERDTSGVVTGVLPAVCGSYAAGAVCCCDSSAHVVQVLSRRGVFTTAAHAVPITTSAGTYELHQTSADPTRSSAQVLSQALQSRLAQLEVIAATDARRSRDGSCTSTDNDLLVIDGPLRERGALPRALGYIKSHQSTYLPPELNVVVSTLRAGERTPVFRIGSRWDSHTWYLRLPTRPGSPWAGVVRVEASADLPSASVINLANVSQAVLPRYASEEYKDNRAPQNLYPIAGLERDLKHRMGDQRLVYRALRSAAQ
ncbi:MAG: hypothetical protein ACRYG2_13905 [Janthinobacterium lividum]